MTDIGDGRNAGGGVTAQQQRVRSIRPRPVQLSVRGALATITIDNPPVNALGRAVRAGLWAALDAVSDQAQVRAVLIRAAGRTWPAGADITEFDAVPVPPSLGDICDRLASFGRPVTAVLHGTVLGGGLELALAASARLAVAGTVFGLPEVSLGLVPGAGGTSRLPRLIGAKAALGMMLTGLPVTAERAVEIGLVDGLIDAGEGGGSGDEMAATDVAATLALTLADLPVKAKAVHDTPDDWLSAVADARAGLGVRRRLPAPGRIIDCVEAALLLPPMQAAAVERTAFADLRDTPQSRGLRHAFLAERGAWKHPRLAGVTARHVAHVAVAGDGRAVADIALVLLDAGFSVTLGGDSGEAVATGLARIAAAQEQQLATGRVTAEARDAAWSRLGGAVGDDIWVGADMAVLTGRHAADMARSAAQGLRAGAVIAFDDGSPDIAAAAAATGRAGDAVGLIWGAEPGTARLVEVVAPQGADPGAVAAALSVVRAAGKFGVVVGEAVGSRLMQALQRAADAVLHLGASPFDIDRALTAWGLVAGPYALRDRNGMAGEGPGSPVARALADALATRGWDGRAAGRGFYRYAEGQMTPSVGRDDDSEILTLLRAAREATAARPAPRISAAAIVRHVLAFTANEGARLVVAGSVARPSDIDAIALNHMGFPRWRGGPMQAADEAGLLSLRNTLQVQEQALGPQVGAVPLWDDLIRNGKTFGSLNWT